MDPRTEQMLAERAQRIAATPAPRRGPWSVLHDARRWAAKPGNEKKLLAGALVVVLLVAYYFMVALPAQRADELAMEARAAESLKASVVARQDAVSACLSKAKSDADAQWAAACKARRQGSNCPLPERQAETFERAERNARNACLLER